MTFDPDKPTSSNTTPSKEEWREVATCEGYCEVSTFGNIRSMDRTDLAGRFWKSRPIAIDYGKLKNRIGMVRIYRSKHDYMTKSLPRLVFETFVRPLERYELMIHIDSNRQNNALSNLRAVERPAQKSKMLKTPLEKVNRAYLQKHFIYRDGNLFFREKMRARYSDENLSIQRSNRTVTDDPRALLRVGNGRLYSLSKLIYCYHHDVMPTVVGRKNGIQSDLRIENLEASDRSEQMKKNLQEQWEVKRNQNNQK